MGGCTSPWPRLLNVYVKPIGPTRSSMTIAKIKYVGCCTTYYMRWNSQLEILHLICMLVCVAATWPCGLNHLQLIRWALPMRTATMSRYPAEHRPGLFLARLKNIKLDLFPSLSGFAMQPFTQTLATSLRCIHGAGRMKGLLSTLRHAFDKMSIHIDKSSHMYCCTAYAVIITLAALPYSFFNIHRQSASNRSQIILSHR
jgi:hypothetical protein